MRYGIYIYIYIYVIRRLKVNLISRRMTEERTCRIVVLHLLCSLQFLFHCAAAPPVGQGSSFTRFIDHTRRRTTVGRIPLDEWSARRRDITQHSQQTNIHAPGGIRTCYPSKRAVAEPALHRVATGTGFFLSSFTYTDSLMFCAALSCLLPNYTKPFSFCCRIKLSLY